MNENEINEMNENEEVKRSEQIKHLARSLESGKSKAAKQIESLIEETDDEVFKKILRDKLSEIDQPDMSIERAIREIEGLGYSERYILKLGLSKLGNQLQWQEKKVEKEKDKYYKSHLIKE
jgi:hypothetical protein